MLSEPQDAKWFLQSGLMSTGTDSRSGPAKMQSGSLENDHLESKAIWHPQGQTDR